MKLLKKTLSIALSALVVSGTVAALPFTAEAQIFDGTKTIVTLDSGKKRTLNSTVSAQRVDSAKSYEVLCHNKSVLKVESGAAAKSSGKYYSVTFTIPNTQKEVFITGLTAENADAVQQKLLANYNGEEEFAIESLDFIDAEKVSNEQDSNLCWAATCSNMLQYSGWAERAGFNSEDDLFDAYADSFQGRGNDIEEGIEWFFDGTDFQNESKEGSGAYLPEFIVKDLYSYSELKNDFLKNAPNMIADLKAGKAVGLSIEWRNDDDDQLGIHAVTLFGCITDKAYSSSDYNYYDSFIIADSDNSKNDYNNMLGISDRNRRSVSNTLTVADLELYCAQPFSDPHVKWKGYDAYILSYVSLTPYSKEILSKKETDPTATKNKLTTADFYPTEVCISNTENSYHNPVINGGHFYVSFSFTDETWRLPKYEDSANYEGDLKIVCKLRNSEGTTIQTQKKNVTVNTVKNHDYFDSFEFNDIAPGKYTVLITVNDDKNVIEAYYINNNMTKEFEVAEGTLDFSGISFKLDADTISLTSDSVEVPCKFDGLDTCAAAKKIQNSTLYISYFEDGKWSAPETPDMTFKEYQGIGSLPDIVTVKKRGTKVKCILTMSTDSGEYTIATPECDLAYTQCTITPTANNTYETTVMPRYSNKLADNEKIAFTIKNTSPGLDNEVQGYYSLVAIYDGKFIALTASYPFTLKKGEETQEITFDAFKSDFKPENSFRVIAGIQLYDGTSEGCDITYFRIHEEKSTVINTPIDIADPCDGQISLREAVAYAEETGSTVTADLSYFSYSLYSSIQINGKVKIDLDGSAIEAAYYSGMLERMHIFELSKGAHLEISNTTLRSGYAESNGGGIYNNGGSLILNNCRIDMCGCQTKGGAIYSNGGKLIVKNSLFTACNAPYGTAIFLDGGTNAEILNTFIGSPIETKGVIYNRSGTLNIINSTIIPLYRDNYENDPDAKKYNRAVIANNNTNIVNSIVFTRNDSAVSGNVNVYSSAINNADPEVKVHTGTITGQMSDIFSITENTIPRTENPDNCHMTLYLTEKAAKGCKTTNKNGKLVLTDSSGKAVETNITTSFTNQDLIYDCLGNSRSTIMGSVSKIIPFGTLLTSSNTELIIYSVPAYNGKAITPKYEIFCDGTILTKDVDFTASFKNNKNAGNAKLTIKGINNYRGTVSMDFTIPKAKNPLSAKAVVKYVQASKLAKAKQLVKKAITVTKNKGDVSYKKVSGSKYLKISSKGVITLSKGKFKKGIVFKAKIKVTAKGTANYKAGSKQVTVRIKVK